MLSPGYQRKWGTKWHPFRNSFSVRVSRCPARVVMGDEGTAPHQIHLKMTSICVRGGGCCQVCIEHYHSMISFMTAPALTCCWLRRMSWQKTAGSHLMPNYSRPGNAESGILKQFLNRPGQQRDRGARAKENRSYPKVSRMWAKPFGFAHSGPMSSRTTGSAAFLGPIRMKKPGFGDQRRGRPLLIGTCPARPSLYPCNCGASNTMQTCRR